MAQIRCDKSVLEGAKRVEGWRARLLIPGIAEIIRHEEYSSDSRKWCTAGVWPAVIRQGKVPEGMCLVAYDPDQDYAWVVAGPQCFIGDLLVLENADWLYSQDRNFEYYLVSAGRVPATPSV